MPRSACRCLIYLIHFWTDMNEQRRHQAFLYLGICRVHRGHLSMLIGVKACSILVCAFGAGAVRRTRGCCDIPEFILSKNLMSMGPTPVHD